MNFLITGAAGFLGSAENEQHYTTDLPDADIPPDVLTALSGIKDWTPDIEMGEQASLVLKSTMDVD